MSISELCQEYLSLTTSGNWDNWKTSLHNIGRELEANKHPDFEAFQGAACALMMNDKPGFWNWLHLSLTKLVKDSTSRLDSLPVLPDYDELSNKDLVEKFECNDGNYSKQEILTELSERFPSIIQCNDDTSVVNLREKLKLFL